MQSFEACKLTHSTSGQVDSFNGSVDQFMHALDEGYVDDKAMVELLGKCAQINLLVKEIIAEDDSQEGTQGIFYLVGDRFWQIEPPPWFWESSTNQDLRAAYVIVEMIHKICGCSKILECIIRGRWPWDVAKDWCFILAILAYCSTRIIAFVAEDRRDFPVGLLLQIVIFGIILGTQTGGNLAEE